MVIIRATKLNKIQQRDQQLFMILGLHFSMPCSTFYVIFKELVFLTNRRMLIENVF